MAVERVSGGSSLIDVLDRVLDKGIVIDAWVRISLVGIDLITVEARIVVASIDTYLRYSDAVGAAATASRPTFGRHGASKSALRNDDDDDDNGDGGGGSSGAPATLRVEIQPRRRPPGASQRTRHR
jgi:gas vesicle structural protein